MASTVAQVFRMNGQSGERVHGFGGNVGVYATGGVVITPAQVALSRIDQAVIPPASGYMFQWVQSTGKMMVFRGDNANASPAPGVEVSNAVDLTAIPFFGIFFGV